MLGIALIKGRKVTDAHTDGNAMDKGHVVGQGGAKVYLDLQKTQTIATMRLWPEINAMLETQTEIIIVMETELVVKLDGAKEYQDDWFALKKMNLLMLIKLEQQMYLIEQEKLSKYYLRIKVQLLLNR
jgi:hypothetical protein